MDPTLQFTPVDDDPFATMTQYASSLPAPQSSQDQSTHWATQSGMPYGGREMAADLTVPMTARVASAIPIAIGDQISGLANAAVGGVTLPGDVAQGKVDPLSTEGIQRSTNLAGLLTSPALEGTPAAADTAGIFAGAKSQTADLNALKQAQLMDAVGADKTEIWDKTGWFTGADGKWRYEIPDNQAELTPRAQYSLGAVKNTMGNSPQVINHPDLYAAYPELKNLSTGVDLNNQIIYHPNGGVSAPQASGSYIMGGIHDPEELGRQQLEINATNLDLNKKGNPVDIGVHELQHAVQDIEGFSPGANPSMFNESHGDPYSAYTHAAGEVEARNVQRRRNWSDEGLKDRMPWSSEDTARPNQIILSPVDHDPYNNYTPIENNPFE